MFTCATAVTSGLTPLGANDSKCDDATPRNCFCNSDDCNAADPQIKCDVGATTAEKKEMSCQQGIVNCKKVTTSKYNFLKYISHARFIKLTVLFSVGWYENEKVTRINRLNTLPSDNRRLFETSR